MKDLSIIIPSLRPDVLGECLSSIAKYTNDLDYEILVNTKSGGIYKAVEEEVRRARGRYIIHIPDDVLATEKWASNMIKFLEGFGRKLVLGNFRCFVRRVNGTPSELTENYVKGKLVSSFPCIKRSAIKRIGFFIDCIYNSFYGDPDLSLRVWQKGGKVVTAPDAWLQINEKNDIVHQESKDKYWVEDRRTFRNRWGTNEI